MQSMETGLGKFLGAVDSGRARRIPIATSPVLADRHWCICMDRTEGSGSSVTFGFIKETVLCITMSIDEMPYR
jgi:hypothetical protein